MHELLNQMNVFFQNMGVQGLALNSFIESFFLVPPPDILLISLDLAKPEKALYYAFICTIFSALGGVMGYLIGLWGGRPVFNFLFRNKQEQFNKVENLYNTRQFFGGDTPLKDTRRKKEHGQDAQIRQCEGFRVG